jgi:ribosomal protein S12 methylthiotransferase accessory factor
MEAIERYCAEPRNPDMVRGTFAYLRSHRRVVPPRAVAAARDGLDDIPLMWTPACDLRLGVEVLAPAECIYFPFPTGAFSTPRLLASPGSNGLASGSTYLEAVVHGLYELIERMYTAQLQCGKARLEAMWEEEVDLGPATVPPSYELQLYAVHLDGGWRELPMVIALLVGDDDVYMGRGCAAELDIAIDRAISEVCQATVTTHRGARAHLAASPDGGAPDVSFQLPSHRSLRVVDYRASVVDRRFADLGSELRFLLDWLGEAGFPVVLAANLTRVGIEVPVVRTMVPGMPTVERAEIPTGEGWDDRSINALRYGYRHGV